MSSIDETASASLSGTALVVARARGSSYVTIVSSRTRHRHSFSHSKYVARGRRKSIAVGS